MMILTYVDSPCDELETKAESVIIDISEEDAIKLRELRAAVINVDADAILSRSFSGDWYFDAISTIPFETSIDESKLEELHTEDSYVLVNRDAFQFCAIPQFHTETDVLKSHALPFELLDLKVEACRIKDNVSSATFKDKSGRCFTL